MNDTPHLFQVQIIEERAHDYCLALLYTLPIDDILKDGALLHPGKEAEYLVGMLLAIREIFPGVVTELLHGLHAEGTYERQGEERN